MWRETGYRSIGTQVKIFGGSMYGNWLNAAMALNRLEGMEARLTEATQRSIKIFAELNKVNGIKISALDGGTNLFSLQFDAGINGEQTAGKLFTDHAIRMPSPGKRNEVKIAVNETLLYRDADYVIAAFKKSLTR